MRALDLVFTTFSIASIRVMCRTIWIASGMASISTALAGLFTANSSWSFDMKLVINSFLVLIVLAAIGNSQPQAVSPLPSVDDVIANMVKFDAERQSGMTGYMAVRHYTAVNNKRKAEMLVRVVCGSDGTKQFRLIGEESLDTGKAYVLEVSPKTSNKYLINGKIWVDAKDYSIVRIEGQPARNPSFWVH